MNSCKILVYYPEDFRIVSGTILESSPFKIKINISPDELEPSIATRIKWYEGDQSNYASVALKEGQQGVFQAELTSDITVEKDETHFIEYKDYFEVVKADPAKLSDLKHTADKLNNRYRSNLSTQIKKIITDETLTNQYLFKLLLQIDEKMDELLDSLKQEDTVDGLVRTKMLSFGGGGLSFLYEGKGVSEGDIVYIQSKPKGATGVNFAALCKITDTIDAGEKTICEAGYEYIDESTRETIIHYIFQKEREQLKRKRD